MTNRRDFLKSAGAATAAAAGAATLAAPAVHAQSGNILIDSDEGEWTGGELNADAGSSIEIRPGRDESFEPFGMVESARFTTVKRWADDDDPDFVATQKSFLVPIR